MRQPAAVLDACVLYSASLRDLFMWLATTGVYYPKWSVQIHAEWVDNVLKNRSDLSREKLERTRDLMNLHAEGSMVEGFEYLIPTLSLPDENDRHVFAVAIESQADVIVTYNLADFPVKTLANFGIAPQHPDHFLCDLYDEEPDAFLDVLREISSHLKNPPRNLDEHLDVLRSQGLKRLVERVEGNL